MTAGTRRHGRASPRALRFGSRALLLSLGVGLPGTLSALGLLWTGDYSPKLQWTLSTVSICGWLALAFAMRGYAVRPLQTLANLLSALREGDYSLRARAPRPDDELGLVYDEINRIGSALREQRLGAIEASTLLRQVMAELDVAVFVFDAERRLVLQNRAGERLLRRSPRAAIGAEATTLGLADCLEGKTPRTIELAVDGQHGRWELSRSPVRQGGVRHELVVLSNLSRALREEEREAWKRLVRVLSHEINNSLAPIQSIAGSLQATRDAADLASGLRVIQGRAEALARFMRSYARLAKLPAPVIGAVDVGAWVSRVAALESRLPVRVLPGPELAVAGDSDQLDQVLINLVQNAADAALEAHPDDPAVELGWAARDARVEVFVRDNGRGVAQTANLFVPFFTTKPKGSGIGLALSRQIAEAHDGALSLATRADGDGAIARLLVPRAPRRS